MKENVLRGVTVQDGVISIAGVSVETLAEQCGTPLYIYDQDSLQAQMKAYVDHFKSPDFETRIVYATKAFNCKAMLQLCHQEGLYADAVSLGEIYTAKAAGIPMDTVYFHGNNKSALEMRKAFEYGVGTLIVDSLEEAQKLAIIAGEYPKTTMRILIRINPDIEAATHHYIQTAAPDSKFGIPKVRLENIKETVAAIQSMSNLEFCGFHAHIGSQLLDLHPFVEEASEMAAFIERFEQETGVVVKELDLGGGFGVWYTDQDEPMSTEEVSATLAAAVAKTLKEHSLQIDLVTIEPGRSIVAESGYLLYTITLVKQNLKNKFLFVDGGMSDNIRPALYEAAYTAEVATKADREKDDLVTIAGKCCESGDIIARDVLMPQAVEGDLLLIYTAGAYGYAMASNYNKLPLPGVVFVKDGSWRWAIRPQSLEEMIEREEDL